MSGSWNVASMAWRSRTIPFAIDASGGLPYEDLRHRCDAPHAQVIVAIRAVQDHKGASRQAIVKYLKSEFQCENGVAIKKALKSDKLVQTGLLLPRRAMHPSRRRPTKSWAWRTSLSATARSRRKATRSPCPTSARWRRTARASIAGKDFRFTLGAGPFRRGRRHSTGRMGPGHRRHEASAAGASSSCRRKLGYGKKGSGAGDTAKRTRSSLSSTRTLGAHETGVAGIVNHNAAGPLRRIPRAVRRVKRM